MALFLSEIHNRVLSVGIWQLWQGGNLALAAAGSVVLVGIMGALILITLIITGGTLVQRGGLSTVRG